MDLSYDDLIEIGLDVVEAAGTEVPTGLGDRVVGAALHGRPGGIVAWAGTTRGGITPLDAFITTAAELSALLDELDGDEWELPTIEPAGQVSDLVRHLVGVERYVLGQLGRLPALDAPRREDHYPVARRAAADLDGAPPMQLSRAWWLEVLAELAACGEVGPEHPVTFHFLPGTVGGLLVVRTFELWTHADDIRRATGRQVSQLDGKRLALMSSMLVDVLAMGMALSGAAQPGRTARLHLTGPGGATHDVALAPGQEPGAPDVVITAETVDVCRLAANRLSIHELRVRASGDTSLVEPVLVGAGAFALD